MLLTQVAVLIYGKNSIGRHRNQDDRGGICVAAHTPMGEERIADREDSANSAL